MALSKDAIFAAPKFELREVDVPEWGGSVFVRTMSGSERDRFQKVYEEKQTDQFMVRILAATCCDEEGNLLFSDADIEELGRLNCKALDRVADAAVGLNKTNAKETDDLEKKSEEAPGDSSSSDSLDTTA